MHVIGGCGHERPDVELSRPDPSSEGGTHEDVTVHVSNEDFGPVVAPLEVADLAAAVID